MSKGKILKFYHYGYIYKGRKVERIKQIRYIYVEKTLIKKSRKVEKTYCKPRKTEVYYRKVTENHEKMKERVEK